ncbi:MAG: calcium/sodium antiporter [Gemmatimonadota bacterium]|nr:MAG: calcium/sodium antiporter [Gemmatimonadota bacterium]
MITDVLKLIGGVGVVFFGAEWLVRGAARLATRLGVPPVVLGLTIVSLGTSAPELVVGVVAAAQGSGGLALGNVMGSNLANIGLILAVSAMIRPMAVSGRVVTREVPIMLLITGLVYPVLMDFEVSRLEGLGLLGLLVVYLAFVFKVIKDEDEKILGDFERLAKETAGLDARAAVRIAGLLIMGSAGLALGGFAVVEGATSIAMRLNISHSVIGFTAVAIGTSIPELATSAVAAYRNEADIAVGNVIGSNVFNLTAILGVAALVRPLDVEQAVLSVEFPAVVMITVLLVPIVRTNLTIRRSEGAVLLGAYAALAFWVLF